MERHTRRSSKMRASKWSGECRYTLRFIALAAFVIALIWLALSLNAGDAHASPDDCVGLHDPRLCEPSRVFYCPGQGMVTWLQPCSNYVIGPPAPGVPSDD